MKTTFENRLYDIGGIQPSVRDDRQTGLNSHALTVMQTAARRHRFEQNQRWAELDSQAVDMLARRDKLRQDSNTRGVTITERALGNLLAAMKNLLDNEAA